MTKIILITITGLLLGGLVALLLSPKVLPPELINELLYRKPASERTVIGFLPYWLLSKADKEYTKYVDTIAYFSLTIDQDGSILKFTNPGESEPGYLALTSGKADEALESFQSQHFGASLVLFGYGDEVINRMMDDPETSASTLAQEVSPLLDLYAFSDLNIDIEKTGIASESARAKFTSFTKTLHDYLKQSNPAVSISVDVSPTALIKPYLINVEEIEPYVDSVIFMTYDYHYQNSSVTGAVSPVGGAGITAEYDTETAIIEALRFLPSEKIIVGVPLYGYQWETLGDYPRAAIIPGTGLTASNKRVEELLESCATCSAQYDEVDQESYVIYKNPDTDTYTQIFYPDEKAVQAKVDLVEKYNLGGIALWALGYDGETILKPLKNF